MAVLLDYNSAQKGDCSPFEILFGNHCEATTVLLVYKSEIGPSKLIGRCGSPFELQFDPNNWRMWQFFCIKIGSNNRRICSTFVLQFHPKVRGHGRPFGLQIVKKSRRLIALLDYNSAPKSEPKAALLGYNSAQIIKRSWQPSCGTK